MRRGDDPEAVARRLRRTQRWEWGAIALDTNALTTELISRYELSTGEPETEIDWDRIPSGLLMTCEVLLRGAE